MIFIADGGSTKVDWRVIGDDSRQMEASTIGFNPFFYNSEAITEELNKSFAKAFSTDRAKKVFFYGSGCTDEFRKSIVRKGLEAVFPHAEIMVHDDLLAAARATCFHKPGITCILGTGSNSGLYDGEKIIDNVTSLGFLLGDEASGAYLGKALIQAYFYRELPEELCQPLEKRFQIEKEALLNKLYGNPHANVYLASYTRFLVDYKNHSFVKSIVELAFTEFIDRHISKYKDHKHLPVHFVGSVALFFQHLLKPLLEKRELHPGIITNRPIDNLVKFHLETENLIQ